MLEEAGLNARSCAPGPPDRFVDHGDFMHDCRPNPGLDRDGRLGSVQACRQPSNNAIQITTNGPFPRTAMNAPQAPPPFEDVQGSPTRDRSRSTRSASSRSAIRSRSRDKRRRATCTIAMFNMYVSSAAQFQRARTCRASSRSSTATSARSRREFPGDALLDGRTAGSRKRPRRDELPYFMNKAAPVSGVQSLDGLRRHLHRRHLQAARWYRRSRSSCR